MEHKTKSFIWGTLAGTTLIVLAITALSIWIYFKGTAIQTEKSAQKEQAVKEQLKRFDAVCSNATPEAMTYLYKTLTPALSALQHGIFDWPQLPALTEGVKKKEAFLRHCGGEVVSPRDENSFKLSRRLMAASTQYGYIHAYLHGIEFGMRMDKCDKTCQKDLTQRAAKASEKLGKILRDGSES